MTTIFYKFFLLLSTISLLLISSGCNNSSEKYEGYLFAYFTGNGPGEEAIRFAVSIDGYNYRALNNNMPIVDSKKISTSGGVRDPHILRGHDQKHFYMTATDLYVPKQGWSNFAMVLMKSTDLINWETSVVNIPETFPEEFGDVHRVWAPQTIYDKITGKYMVYFSMKKGDNPDIIYYAYANKDFTGLESAPKQLYFPPTESQTKACIDGDIIPFNDKFYLFHKAEDGDPGIKLAISDQLTEGYHLISDKRVDCEKNRVEGSSIFKLNNSDVFILMYDVYTNGRYQFTKSSDLKNFSVIDKDISMNFHPRHGTVIPITQKEFKKLVCKWGKTDDILIDVTSSQIKQLNVDINEENKTIYLPVKRGVDLTRLNPQFRCWPGISLKPEGPQDFSKGPVTYSFSIKNQKEVTYTVNASIDHNPVLEGYYADPEILYSEKTGQYYIYPTSDGFQNWSGDYFKVFSSDNMVDWTDKGKILNLKKDVSWANHNAWAPCIIEKKIANEFKYFFYYSAEQKIGIAVSENPTGPFKDSGKALIDFKSMKIKHGQEIDPDVFTDPKTNKSYLYWGNGYMAAAELNTDMVTINKESVKIMNVDKTYREGSYVFYRKGVYYFMWSEDDTRSPNYKVRYATAESPLGELSIPQNNIVIQQAPQENIFATGHCSAIKVPGKEEWYIVYHRFTRPKGIKMGNAGGFHREVCIDKLEFDADGHIIEVKPTLRGIEPIN